eukprot:TRINITY_DN88106_c0_g1_i1.p1 TRINITY_DN88106_c0_g1~~TRINITY_DN88106_c0_g1_i1.p1  ORF type:complete len:439 (+),score=57.04 TRINITY_DN88106_c0_g1_i1:196-1317(+)
MSKEEISKRRCWKEVIHEIEIQRRVDHQNCCKFIEVLHSDDDLFLVLEMVQGGELYNVIIKRKHLTEREAAFIAKQLLNALYYLHEKRGIVHRDLKPENILIDENTLKIKIVDFGFAKFVGKVETPGSGGAGATEWPAHMFPTTPTPGAFLAANVSADGLPAHARLASPKGTVVYMAPEILETVVQRRVKPRVTTREGIKKLDMFAVGVVLFIMLGGRFPWPYDQRAHPKHQAASLLPKIVDGVAFKQDSWGQVSEQGKDFCSKLLEKDSTKRLGVGEALKHPWIVGCDQVPETPMQLIEQKIDNHMYSNIRKADAENDSDDPVAMMAKQLYGRAEQQQQQKEQAGHKIEQTVQVSTMGKPQFNLDALSVPKT